MPKLAPSTSISVAQAPNLGAILGSFLSTSPVFYPKIYFKVDSLSPLPLLAP